MLALVLGAGASLILLYLGEAAVRITATDPGMAALREADAAGRPFDSRSRIGVVRDLRAQGVDAVPRIVPSGLREPARDGTYQPRLSCGGRGCFPLSGLSRRTTVLCNETGEFAVFESDEHGFRNPLGLWEGGRAELLLLGDSFTIGECVAPGANIGDRLRARVPATLNLGYSGNSPVRELATLAEYGHLVEPRRVLWIFFENDLAWFDLGKDARTPLLMRYLDETFSQDLVGSRGAIDESLEALVDEELDRVAEEDLEGSMGRSEEGVIEALVGFAGLRELRIRLGGLRDGVRGGSEETPDYALFRRVLAAAKRRAAAWDGELVFVYLPGVWKFSQGSWSPAWGSDEVREEVLTIAGSLDLRLVDVESAMREHDDPLSLYSYRGLSKLGSPHMNADGYAFAAGVVLDELER